MDTVSLFTFALQLPDPWMVSGVEFRGGTDSKRELHITIGFHSRARASTAPRRDAARRHAQCMTCGSVCGVI